MTFSLPVAGRRVAASASEGSWLGSINRLDVMLASILLGPLAVLDVAGRTPNLFWIDIVIAGLAVLALTKVWARPNADTFRFPPAAIWAFGYLAVCTASVLLTQDILAAVAVLKLRVMPVAVFLLAYRYVRTRDDLEHFFKSLLWFGLALATISLYHWYLFSTGALVLSEEFGAKDMLQLSFGRSNYLASMFIVLIPLMLGFVRQRESRPSFFFCAGALLLVFIALVFTQSRGGLISLTLGLLSWAFFSFARSFTPKTAFKGLAAALLMVGIAVFLWYRIPEEVRSDLSMTFGILWSDAGQGNYGGGRTELWLGAIKGAWDSDLFGIGIGNQMFFYAREQMTPWAHNLYLETLLETGLVGLIALLGVVVAFGKTSWRLWKTSSSSDRPMTGALLVTFVTALINNAQEPSFWGPQYSCLFWMIMGVAYSWRRMLLVSGSSPAAPQT